MESINEGKRNKYSKILIIISTVLVISMLAPIASIPINASSPTIWTDKEDYKPEETVIIYGEGFKGNSEIRISVTRPDNVVDSWTVTSEPDGGFITKYLLDGITGTYHIAATDGTNIATATFKDGAVDQDFFGWKLDDRTTWSGEWTKGDLGKKWKEGDWVSYVLVFNGYGGNVLPPFDITYDFYIRVKDGIFVDLLRNFYYMIRDPYPGSGEPNDITPLNYASYMKPFTPTIINRPFPEGTPDDQTNPPEFAFWRVTPNQVFSDPIPPGKSVVIYFEAHLAQSFIWVNGLEHLYANPPTNTWGGDRYTGWSATHGGAGYTSGSNPQFRLGGTGVGQKTVPIPIPPLPTGQICGVKYHDLNVDGVKDLNEPGLEGWTINLNAVISGMQLSQSTTTNSSGSYCFTMLPEGTYIVSEVLQTGWMQSAPKPVPPGTHVVNLYEGMSVTDRDFGNFKLGNISGYKWNDIDGDGVWGAGEPALNNWTIVLYRGSVAVASVVTDISGYYEFVGLSAGSYGVCEVLIEGWMQTYPGGVGCHNVTITSGMNLEDLNFGNKELLKFLKTFSDSGSLSGYVKPVIVDPITSDVSQIKTGPGIWWEITYFVENKDSEGHYYILWDKWGGNLMVLNSTPIAFNQSTKLLTLADGVSFKIDYSGYSAYLGTGLTLNPSKGTAIATLHKGDQQQGTNPGKGKGTTNDGKAYDVDIRWEIGWLNPGESATLKIYLAPGQNPGGQLQFSSWGTYVINTGPRVRAYLDLDGDGNPYENNEFQYSWDFTNQLTVNVYPK